jgi:DNA-binding NtrC family response regulator
MRLLPALRALSATMPIVLLTGYGTVDLAVRAVKIGADDVLTKPVPMSAILERVRSLLGPGAALGTRDSGTHKLPRAAAIAKGGVLDPAERLLGESPAMRALHRQLRALHDADCPVLVLGETGTGKGVVARVLHDLGPRAPRPFVDVNCAVLSRELFESELFGHARGAFTGAHARKTGLFESAEGGTLFLDEIGDVDPMVQPKLLKAIEDRRFRRVGEVEDRTVDVRLLAATHHDLLEATRTRTFRGDLFYRISTISIDVPPLREREMDVVLLARAFLSTASERYRRPGLRFHPSAELALLAHRWPGNVRELRNVVDRAALLTEGEVVGVDAIRLDRAQTSDAAASTMSPAAMAASTPTSTLQDVERSHVETVLVDEGWDVGRAARRLGIARSTLYVKIKTFRLMSPRARAAASNDRLR